MTRLPALCKPIFRPSGVSWAAIRFAGWTVMTIRFRLWLAAGLAALCCVWSPGTHAGTAPKLFGVPGGCDNDVRAIVRAPTGLVYLAGDFTICEETRAFHVVAYDPVQKRFSALSEGNANGVDSSVSALAMIGNELYAAGSFANAGGRPASRIARWDGLRWHRLGSEEANGVLGEVAALAVTADGALIVGGEFTRAGAVDAKNIARWDGSAWSALGAGVGTGESRVRALAVNGSDLYVGGLFASAGAVAARNIARWDGSNWAAVGSGLGSATDGDGVYALATGSAGNAVVAGGTFQMAGAVRVNNIARWNGTAWSGFGNSEAVGTDSTVQALHVAGEVVHAGGAFVFVTGQPARYVARWNGTSWSALGGLPDVENDDGVDQTVRAMLIVDGDLQVVGGFRRAGDVIANRYAIFDGERWLAAGNNAGSGVNGQINALVRWRGQLIVGGVFSQAGGLPANNIAAWNGSAWSLLGPSAADNGVDGEVYSLAVQDDTLVVGGFFPVVGGNVTANHIARFDGQRWTAYGSGMDNAVAELLVMDGTLIAGGNFAMAGGQPAARIARWNGSQWQAFGSGIGAPNSNDLVAALASHGGQLYAGGTFTRAGEVSANYVARWDGSRWLALGNGVDFLVEDLAFVGDQLYVGGGFNFAGNGMPATGIARWDGTQWFGLPGGGGTQGVVGLVLSLLPVGGDLFVGGSFGGAGDQPANGLARWDGQQWQGLGLGGIDQVVTALAHDDDSLFVNGYGLVQTPLPRLLSGTTGGAAADGASRQPAVSGDGAVVAFTSKAGNLVADGASGRDAVYVRVGAAGEPVRISDLAQALPGVPPQDFDRAGLSADGNVVSFQGSGGGVYTAIGGVAHPLTPSANGASSQPVPTASGNQVAFQSSASNLVPVDGNGSVSDVFLSNPTGTLRQLISVGAGGVAGNGPSSAPAPNADGSRVAFVSLADNLATDGPPQQAKAYSARQILLRIADAGAAASVLLVSRNLSTRAVGNGDSDAVRLTPDGRFGVFQSVASNLVDGDTNNASDIFRFEIANRQVVRLTRVSVSSLGQQGNGASRNPVISDDGLLVAYETDASNLVGLDDNDRTDIVVHSLSTGETLRLARTNDGQPPDGASQRPAISGDGSSVLFDSLASNLAPADGNGAADVFGVELGAPSAKSGPNYTGAWYDPAQTGHGLFLEQLDGGRFLAWWFTFDPQGRQAWFGGVGTINGNLAEVPVVRTDGPGGRFIPNFNAAQVTNVPFGTLFFTFTDCGRGRVDFDLFQGFGRNTMNLVRLSQPDDVGGCRNPATTAASRAAKAAGGPVYNATGAWYDPNQAGQGLFIESLADGRLLAWWFTFNPDGGQAWFGTVGTISGQGADFVPLKTTGGRWIPNFDATQISNPALGTMRIQFSSCNNGLVSYDLGQGFGRGSLALTRLSVPLGQFCGR